ncbi:hypothetical protein MUY21_00850 [Aliiroseovarius sp. S2029]|uniref:histidine kinase dimerization/phosphoacceptor domain -containing protein n=1 Tax=Aliiroseovarius sp. S2029 TaxID=2936988 RepID=UPI0020BE7BF8|nr:hypothetical protein [Aliiroseovarius sp. S2029]
MTRLRHLFLNSLQSRFIAVYLIVMAPIAALASYYQFTILSDRHEAREIAALDAVESAFAPVTSTLVQSDLLLNLLGELAGRGMSQEGECSSMIDAVLKADFSVVAAGIYTEDGEPLCTQAMQQFGVGSDLTMTPPANSPQVNLTESELFVTKTVPGHIVAVQANIPSVDLPEITTDFRFASRISPLTSDGNRADDLVLVHRLAPHARGIVHDEHDQDLAILPVTAFDLRLIATLRPGVAAPPVWRTVVNAAFVPLVLLALSLLLADLLIRKLAVNDITRLTRDMKAFRQDRDLPRQGVGPWATDETAAMQAEFSTLSDQLLREEAEAQNRLHNANIMQREIFHRVGNNLQIIQSILRLYAKEAQTQEARQLIDQVAARIRVINLVHNAVHRSVDAPVLSAGQTVSKLIQGLQHEGLIASDIDIDQRFQDVGLRVSQIYALCYLLVEKLTRLSRSGASRIQIDLVEDDATIVLSVSANVGQLAAADPVRARLREVYTRDLRATARWHTETDTVTFTAVIPGQVT